MARLSNFVSSNNADDSHRPIVCRPAERSRGEIEAGLRLILAGASGPAGDETILDFLSDSLHRGIDVNRLWVASVEGRLVWAILPLLSPGRTMLLLSPARLARNTPVAAVGMLADAVCRHFSTEGIRLAQVLLHPKAGALRASYERAGFKSLAKLLYLQRTCLGAAQGEPLGKDETVCTYSTRNHSMFRRIIERSYTDSKDCPALNGLREIEDVIAGHKAAGRFDPSLWFAVCRSGVDAGVLLLNPTLSGDSAELVYLGVCPEARGTGLGDRLMWLAAREVSRRGLCSICLAVDSANTPALRLYHRHGFSRVGEREALLCYLRGEQPEWHDPQPVPKVR